MFGIKYAKFAPGYYVFKYKKGKIVQEGDGLSFTFFSPTTSIVAVKTGSSDAHFMFSEITVDFQEVTIQGQLTYKVAVPSKTAGMLNYTVNNKTLTYITDDPSKLSERLINLALVATKGAVKPLTLKEAVASADKISNAIGDYLKSDSMVESLGIEILNVSITAVRPNSETARALEAQTREQILKESDDAVFSRRNSAVKQERVIRENELNTEIAVEEKQREIREKQMESQMLVQNKQQEMQSAAQEHLIKYEERNKELILLKTDNSKKEAEAKAYAVSSILKAYDNANPQVIEMLANSNMDASRLMALAFQGIADKADKIGQLNISPELLNAIMNQGK